MKLVLKGKCSAQGSHIVGLHEVLTLQVDKLFPCFEPMITSRNGATSRCARVTGFMGNGISLLK